MIEVVAVQLEVWHLAFLKFKAKAYIGDDTQSRLEHTGGVLDRSDYRSLLGFSSGLKLPDSFEACQGVKVQLRAGKPVYLEPGPGTEALQH